MIGWLNYIFMRYRVGRFWQEVAHEYYYEFSKVRPVTWDCDERVTDMKNDMETHNMRIGYDFVYDRGYMWVLDEKGKLIQQNHVRLNVCGMMVDPSTDNEDCGFNRTFLGKYIKSDQKDKEEFMKAATQLLATKRGKR